MSQHPARSPRTRRPRRGALGWGVIAAAALLAGVVFFYAAEAWLKRPGAPGRRPGAPEAPPAASEGPPPGASATVETPAQLPPLLMQPASGLKPGRRVGSSKTPPPPRR